MNVVMIGCRWIIDQIIRLRNAIVTYVSVVRRRRDVVIGYPERMIRRARPGVIRSYRRHFLLNYFLASWRGKKNKCIRLRSTCLGATPLQLTILKNPLDIQTVSSTSFVVRTILEIGSELACSGVVDYSWVALADRVWKSGKKLNKM